MKCKMFILMVFSVLLIAPAFANKMINVDEKVLKMQAELNLTQEQVNQLRPIIQDYKNAVERAGQDKENRLNSILTPDQMNQLKSMKDDYSKENRNK